MRTFQIEECSRADPLLRDSSGGKEGWRYCVEAWLSHGIACRLKIDVGSQFLVKAKGDFGGERETCKRK
ncbi:LOW QUALITY PROTEIN: hypothetical protein TorRG33x02_046040 [Trema orientale]|uniref:Uncharacterized protein n=1 Tax=Trema orientale TaxID=63057 RepID=A0A2P5FNN8_TREOI|nr:LOW QUALITY PROTEIN: hypothetical protein TorRG33x02_046040 [Trema orientale]